MANPEMQSSAPRRNNKKLLIGGVALLGAATLIGAGVFAAFSDTETTGVSAQAGALDITGADDISIENMAPGDLAFRSMRVVLPAEGNRGNLIRAIRLSVPSAATRDTVGRPTDAGDADTSTTAAGESLLRGANGLKVTLATCSTAWTLPAANAALGKDANNDGIDDSAVCGGTIKVTQTEVALSELVDATNREYDASAFGVAPTATGTIPDGSTLNVIAQFRLPTTATNAYENASLGFDFLFEAVQRAGVNR